MSKKLKIKIDEEKKKRAYCLKCKYHKIGLRYVAHCATGINDDICNEPHKTYTHTALAKIDSSDNCHVKNRNNNCKYFKKKR